MLIEPTRRAKEITDQRQNLLDILQKARRSLDINTRKDAAIFWLLTTAIDVELNIESSEDLKRAAFIITERAK
jgi:hypothetical protein